MAGMLAVTAIGMVLMAVVSTAALRGYLMHRIDGQLQAVQKKPALPRMGDSTTPGRYIILNMAPDGTVRAVSGDDPDPSAALDQARRMGPGIFFDEAAGGRPFGMGGMRAVARVGLRGHVTVDYAGVAHPDEWSDSAGHDQAHTAAAAEGAQGFRIFDTAFQQLFPHGYLGDGNAMMAYDATLTATAAIRLTEQQQPQPDAVINELTEMPADPAQIDSTVNARIRTEGHRNVLAAAEAAGARLLAQSLAFPAQGAAGEAVEELERTTLAAGGVVLRYGIFWGPGTYGGDQVPEGVPHVHVDVAAQRTVEALDAPSGVIVVTD